MAIVTDPNGNTRATSSDNERYPLIFPNILRESNVAQIRVPMDDTHTNFFFVYFIPEGYVDRELQNVDYEVQYVQPYKEPLDAIHPFTRFKTDNIMAQDFMTWETQGPIFDRTCERLGTSDRGVLMFREIIKREIEKVRQGLDPIAVVRDPDHQVIDTFLSESMRDRWYQPTQYSSQRGGAYRLEE